MITRDDLKTRARNFNNEKKCALYIESENDHLWVSSTGDIALQIYAIGEYLVSLSNDKVHNTPLELAELIVEFVDKKTMDRNFQD